jgi:tetrahydrodipicolinate N-succinyltransferase
LKSNLKKVEKYNKLKKNIILIEKQIKVEENINSNDISKNLNKDYTPIKKMKDKDKNILDHLNDLHKFRIS